MSKTIGYATAAFTVLAALGVACVDTDGELEDVKPRFSESEQIVENLKLAGFPEGEIGVTQDGTVFVGGDAVVSLQASRELAGIVDDSEGDEGFRQYRTTSVVDTTQVSVICISPSDKFNTNNLMSQALDAAIANYNSQNLQFSMQRGGGGGCDATIAANLDNSGGGVAGFPADGLPYHEFFVGESLAADNSVAVATHVITHELGHCVGFRHTDFFDRSISCGGAKTNEGASDVGAEHIPGTPTGAVLNGSVMNACYNGGSTGEWSADDIEALDCLYNTGSCAPPPPPSYETISSQTNLSGANNSQTHHGPYDASGYDAVRFKMSGGIGDADLYVRFGQAPTTNQYDCRPYASGNTETCEFNPAGNGEYYVMIDAYQAYSDVTLSYEGVGGGGQPDEVCDDGVDNDNDGDTDCDDSDCAGDQACNGGGVCGDGVCDVGESCDGRSNTTSCSADCPGKVNGKPSGRYCYVDGVCEGPGC